MHNGVERTHIAIEICCIQYFIVICMTSSYLPSAYRLIGYSISNGVSVLSVVYLFHCSYTDAGRSLAHSLGCSDVSFQLPLSTSLIFNLSTIVIRWIQAQCGSYCNVFSCFVFTAYMHRFPIFCFYRARAPYFPISMCVEPLS